MIRGSSADVGSANEADVASSRICSRVTRSSLSSDGSSSPTHISVQKFRQCLNCRGDVTESKDEEIKLTTISDSIVLDCFTASEAIENASKFFPLR